MEENLNSDKDEKGAAVRFPPPLIFILLILLAYEIHYFYPVNLGVVIGLKYAGVVIVLFALGLIFYISRIFTKVETNIEPWKPTTTIISTGLFAYSRNPIYVAFCLVPIGMGIFLNSFWVLCSFLPSAFIVNFVVVKKEEAYLEKKFGAEYQQYKNRVRRWL
ncbi:MAG: methyltransferase family protein [Gammaproteobacteria bacterium]|jgi:protein-S-isoprenylcysteine O-methyltransferase Ste14